MDIAIVVLALLAVLFWGANRPLFMALLSAGLVATCIGQLLWNIRRGQVRIRCSPAFFPLAAFLCLAALQYMFPATSLDGASPYFPHTVEPHTTRTYLLLGAGYFALFFSTVNGFHSRRQISALMLVIFGLGIFEAVYGFLQWTGVYRFAWIIPVKPGNIQGTLMNHNHYALLLNIGICTGVGLLYRRSIEMLRAQKLDLRSFISLPESPRLLWILIWIGFMGVGVITSVSRMGIFAMLASLSFMFLSAWHAGKRKHVVILALAVLLAVAGLGVYAGIDAAFVRYAELTSAGELHAGRVKLWKDAWPMILKRPLFGSGLGSFQWTYPTYESLSPDIPATYAHNDYIQAVAETGIVGLALLLWAYVTCFKSALRNFLSKDTLAREVGLTTIGVLVAVAIQEITDYSLYIPGVAVVFILLISLNERACWLERESFTELNRAAIGGTP